MSHCLGGEEMFLWTRVYLAGKGRIFRLFFLPLWEVRKRLVFHPPVLSCPTTALFRLQIFSTLAIVALSFVFGN
jgi:hypothetical protein